MPIYDYRCAACGKGFTAFFRTFAEVSEPACEHCGSRDVAKLPPRVRLVRSAASAAQDLDLGGGMEDLARLGQGGLEDEGFGEEGPGAGMDDDWEDDDL